MSAVFLTFLATDAVIVLSGKFVSLPAKCSDFAMLLLRLFSGMQVPLAAQAHAPKEKCPAVSQRRFAENSTNLKAVFNEAATQEAM